MKTFLYEGISGNKTIKGTIKASSKDEVLKLLNKKGITPIEIKEQKEFLSFSFKRRISTEKISFILAELSTLLESGIPLTKALEILANQEEDEEISNNLLQIKRDIEIGENLSKAFEKSGLFPDFLVRMLSAAQTEENLEHIFKLSAEYLEKISEIKSKIFSSVAYPSFVIAFSLISVFIAVKFVVPKLEKVLQSFGKSLPLVTKIVIFLTDVVFYLFFLIPIGILIFSLLKRKNLISPQRLGLLYLKIPFLGKLMLYNDLVRFSKTLEMLLSAAVPLTTALTFAVQSISNPYLREKLEKIIPQVERGKRLSQLLKEIKEMPTLFVNLIEIGEHSGELEKMLNLLSKTYEKLLFRKIDFYVRMIEPISILIIALVVGIIAVSVILPMAELSTGISLK